MEDSELGNPPRSARRHTTMKRILVLTLGLALLTAASAGVSAAQFVPDDDVVDSGLARLVSCKWNPLTEAGSDALSRVLHERFCHPFPPPPECKDGAFLGRVQCDPPPDPCRLPDGLPSFDWPIPRPCPPPLPPPCRFPDAETHSLDARPCPIPPPPPCPLPLAEADALTLWPCPIPPPCPLPLDRTAALTFAPRCPIPPPPCPLPLDDGLTSRFAPLTWWPCPIPPPPCSADGADVVISAPCPIPIPPPRPCSIPAEGADVVKPCPVPIPPPPPCSVPADRTESLSWCPIPPQPCDPTLDVGDYWRCPDEPIPFPLPLPLPIPLLPVDFDGKP